MIMFYLSIHQFHQKMKLSGNSKFESRNSEICEHTSAMVVLIHDNTIASPFLPLVFYVCMCC